MEPGETPLQAAKRELQVQNIVCHQSAYNSASLLISLLISQEEAGIQAPLKHIGELLFIIEGDPIAFHVDIFRADEYSGVITE